MAGPARHQVVDVLVTGFAPLGRCIGGIGVGACLQLSGALDHNQACTLRGGLGNGRFVIASNGRRHVIEQIGKEAHGVTMP